MPLLCLSLTFIAGILFGDFSRVEWWVWGSSGLLIFILYLVNHFIFNKRLFFSRVWLSLPFSPLLILFALCLGAARYAMNVPTLTSSDLACYNNRGEYTFIGTVSAPPDIRADKTLHEIEISGMTDPREPDYTADTCQVDGTALVTMTRWTEWQYGD